MKTLTYDQIATCTDIELLTKLIARLRDKCFCKRGAELTQAQNKLHYAQSRVRELKGN